MDEPRSDHAAGKSRTWVRFAASFLGALLVSGALWSLYLFFVTVRTTVAQAGLPVTTGAGGTGEVPGQVAAVPGQDLGDLVRRSERVNILLLGIDQREQETGPSRTDTIILLSVDLTNKAAVMLSIPRDLWVTIPGFGENRINTAHFTGDLKSYPGGGIALLKRTIQHNLGVPVHYAVRISFTGFEKLIDAIGGITVDVPNRIYDTQYPDSNYGYMVVDIPAGIQHMDGATALQYARSRHTTGDFDRMYRQQQVILAARDKVLSLDFPVTRIPEILNTLGEAVYTDIPLKDLITLAELAKDIKREDIRFAVIDETMVTTRVLASGAMVEVADWTKVRALVSELFPTAEAALTEESPDLAQARIAGEGARIELQNGTMVADLAAEAAATLRAEGFNVVRYENADRFDYAETVIVVHDTDKEFTLQHLAERLHVGADSIRLAETPDSEFDIVVILGSDYAQQVPTG